MTTATPAQIIDREREHARVRAKRCRAKPQRALQLVGGSRLDPPVFYDPADFPGFTAEQIVAGLTVPAVREGDRR